MNEITMKMQADELIMMALREDITSEDAVSYTHLIKFTAVKIF